MVDWRLAEDKFNVFALISLILALVLAIVTVIVVYFAVPGTALDRLKVVVGYVTLILIFFYGLMVLIALASGKIDLSMLVSEKDGSASISRFQLLIFTFVIALSLFLITISSMEFPKIPAEILTLLGISAATYGVGKGIEHSKPAPGADHHAPADTHPKPPPTSGQGT